MIIVSGETAPITETGSIDWNVPDDSILLEPGSESIYKNAPFTPRICQNRGIDEIVLVTSAWPMRRALGAFQSAGLDVVPAPVDYQGIRRFFPPSAFLPNVRGLAKTTTAFHEYLGYQYPQWQGWVK